jgi:hypothetical protein
MRVGVSGHQRIPTEALAYIQRGIIRVISAFRSNLTGLSSLAAGADQIFADSILQIGGRLHVVIPCRRYETTFSDEQDFERFMSLLKHAETVETLDHADPSEDAFLDAGHQIVDHSELLVAIWDGEAAKSKGGTGDIVEYARLGGKRVEVIWPLNVMR